MQDQIDALRSTLRRALVQLDALESEARVTRLEARRSRMRQRSASTHKAVNPQPTDHALLGVKESASLAEVRAAYAAKAKLVHPDQGGNRSDLERINAAYHRIKAALLP